MCTELQQTVHEVPLGASQACQAPPGHGPGVHRTLHCLHRRHFRTALFNAVCDWITNPSGRRILDILLRIVARQRQRGRNVAPELSPTGEAHTQVMRDGRYFNRWCVLIAYTGTHVIDWQRTDREKHASWSALLSRIPPAEYAIVDGNGPLKSSLTHLWSTMSAASDT